MEFSTIYVQLLIAGAVVALAFALGSYLARRFRMPDHGWKITLALLALGAGAVVTVFNWPPRLGIDLSGGVILVYEVDRERTGDQDVSMTELASAVRSRVNPGGHEEVIVRPYGAEQVEIVVPEADEAELRRMKDILLRIGSLEFRILAHRRDPRHQHQRLITLAEAERNRDAREILDEEGNRLGWWVPVHAEARGEFARQPDLVTRERVVRGEERREVLVVDDQFNVTGEYLVPRRVRADVDERGPKVRFGFNPAGGRRFRRLTGANLPDPSGFSRQLGIILDGHLRSAPNIRDTIGDQGEITGSFTREEVETLVSVLQAGSLPAALTEEPISEMLIGPTLGRDTIRRGSIAITLAMVLVLVFMLVYYRFAGVVACGALLATLLLVLSVMITFRAAFTLPGLAGLVLTVGMAVDANVLIFERIREELGRGAALRMAIRNGFSRATTTIVDANLTTLITATILYAVGTDQIRGFAITLWLGVVMSMFTAIFCSRIVFDIAEKRRWITNLNMMHIFGKTNFNFLGRRHLAAACSGFVILVGMVGVFARGQGLLDIDFTGGVSVEAVFAEPQPIAEVRTALADLEALAVSDVRYEGEVPRTRFLINTSEQNTEYVEQHLYAQFGEKLVTNALTFSDLRPLAAPAELPAEPEEVPAEPEEVPAEPEEVPAEPEDVPVEPEDVPAEPEEVPTEPGEDPAEPEEVPTEPEEAPFDEAPETSRRSDLPHSRLLASADGTTVHLASLLAGADEPGEDAPAEPGPNDAELEPAAPDLDVPATTSTDPEFAGGTATVLTLRRRLAYDSLEARLHEHLERLGHDPNAVPLRLTNEEHVPGETRPFDTWNLEIGLPPSETHSLLTAVDAEFRSQPYFPSSNTIGSQVAGDMSVRAVYALFLSLVCIVGYIWLRFQRVVYGLAAVVALLHDVLITLGIIALSAFVADALGFLLIDPFKIGLTVVAAFLTIIGYSLNDTIVVFDRIREVRGKAPQLTADMVNTSINQTLGRTLLTSLTTLVVVLILYVGGGQAIHAFAFALVVGVLVGTYSSVFVASPFLYWLIGSEKRA